MAVMLTLHTGYDVAYLTDAVAAGGADYYLSAAGEGGEPPGQWEGQGAEALGLAGEVDAQVMRGLYHHDVGPGGVPLETYGKRPVYTGMADTLEDRIEAEIAARVAELGRDVPERKVAEIRLMVEGRQRNSVPFFDFTLSAVKSISVAAASYQAAAAAATEAGDEAEARRCMAKVHAIEGAMREGARQVVRSAEASAAFVRTGHHGEGQGQWRDAEGLVAAVFLQHTSRDGDPQLHTHIALLNRARRADGEDTRWRTLDSRSLHRERLRIAAEAGMVVEQNLLAEGFSLVQREDGQGREIQGVEPATMRAFSSRRAAITPAIKRLADEYEQAHGRAPSRRALWSLRQWATLETRKGKHEVERTAGESLAAWEAQSQAQECQVLGDVQRTVERFGRECTPAAPCTEDMHRAVRIAVHEVQARNATWTAAQLAWELYRAMPPRDAATSTRALLLGMLSDALTGQVEGVEVVALSPAPDVANVSMLGVRKDGASVYRPPGEARYCTAEMLDTEEYLFEQARRKLRQVVSGDDAQAATGGGSLDPNQAEVVRGLLTGTAGTSVLIGPAGSGKTHVVAKFAAAWSRLAGGRVIGLTSSTNAARQLALEGMAETWNIAQFLGKLPDTDRTRGHIDVGAGDVLVVDEASQVGTRDLAAIQAIASRYGARLILTGDTAQLGAVEAGGIMGEIAKRQGYWQLHEVRRFTKPWEARASLAMREGNVAAWIDYRIHGRIRSGPQDVAYAKAVELWATDHVLGRDSVLLAGSNAEAAELARLARARLVSYGRLPAETEVTLSDGNEAGTGDLVRARLNCKIDAGGRALTNRDTLRVTGWSGAGEGKRATVERQTREGWSEPFEVPVAYLAESAELAYAGNVHVAQGRTVDRGHLVVSDTLSRESLYVGMTRGKDGNEAHVVTGPPVRPGLQRPVEQAPPAAVLAAAMERESTAASAHQVMRDAQAFATNSRHLFELWQDLVRGQTSAAVDEAVKARLPEREYQRYLTDPQRPVFQRQMRSAELAGHDVAEVIGKATAGSFEGARSIAAVLHGRVERLGLAEGGNSKTWADRTPKREAAAPRPEREPSAWRQELDAVTAALDHRQRELGEKEAEQPSEWALRSLGVPPAEPGALRDDWVARVGRAASYRDAAGIRDPAEAVGDAPKQNPALLEAWQSSVQALELRETYQVRAQDRGGLEAHVQAFEREKAWAPQPVGRDLELTALAEEDAEAQAATALESGEAEMAGHADALRDVMTAERQRLEVKQAARVEWEEATRAAWERAAEAEAELARRGHEPEPVREPEVAPEPVAEAEVEAPAAGRNGPERETEVETPEPVVAEAEPVREAESVPEPVAERDEIDEGLERIERAAAEQREAQQAAREAEAERYEAERSAAAWRQPEISQPEAEAEIELER